MKLNGLNFVGNRGLVPFEEILSWGHYPDGTTMVLFKDPLEPSEHPYLIAPDWEDSEKYDELLLKFQTFEEALNAYYDLDEKFFFNELKLCSDWPD